MKSPRYIFTLLICLYFSQGLPSGMLAHALPAIMREYGTDVRWIGLIKLLAIPWFLKFLWAPFIDQNWQRKYWIILFQSFAIGLLLLMSVLPPEQIFNEWLVVFFILILLLNTCSASQDIASDGLAVRNIDKQELGLANSIQVGAYKVGLIGGGTLLLIFLGKLGWQFSLQMFAACLLLALLPVFLYKQNSAQTGIASFNTKPAEPHLSMKKVFIGFIREANMGIWLCIILTYKMADGLSSSMIKPMLVDYGFSLSQIGYLGTFSSLAGIIGAIIGGIAFRYLPLRFTLISFGALQAIGIGLLSLIPALSHSLAAVYALSLFEQFTDNLSTVALFAAMMMHCRKGLEGTDYTLQNSFYLTGSGIASLASGFITAHVGYHSLFLIASVLGFASLSLLFLHRIEPTVEEAPA